MSRLLVNISGHGLGHLGQTAPVLSALRQTLPDLALSVRCPLPREVLAKRLPGDFQHIREACDVGFIQHDALSIDHPASRAAYREFHADYAARVARETAFLRHLAPTLVLSNVAYLPLAGAALAGIPALAMSSLNWLDLVDHYYGEEDWAAPVLGEIAAAYASAATFVTLAPAMPMKDLPHLSPVGAVARVADPEARREVRRGLGVADEAVLVLLAVGGFHLEVESKRWPQRLGDRPLRYLTPAAWHSTHQCSLPYAVNDDFIALLGAADAVVTKPGYGTFAEAACNGKPVLYLRREDWPEQDSLIPWLEGSGRCAEIRRRELANGQWTDALAALLALTARPPVAAEGAAQVAALLAAKLELG